MDQPERLKPVVGPRRVPLASPDARWLVAAAALGSGSRFLTDRGQRLALPAIGRKLGAGLTGQQWILGGYLPRREAYLLSS